jgi:hypothetical protein
MKLKRVHPLSIVSFVALVAALVLPFTAFGLKPGLNAALGVVALGSAFLVVSAGHFLVEPALLKQLALAAANVPLMVLWWLAVAAMSFLAPGLPGAVAFGVVLCLPALLLLVLLRRRGKVA